MEQQPREVSEVTTIKITDPGTLAFYAGVAKGSDLADTMDNVLTDVPFEQKVAWYWLYVGTAVVQKGITEDVLDRYIAGAATRAPQRKGEFVLTLDVPEVDDEDAAAAISAELAHQLHLVRQSLLDSGTFEMKGSVYGDGHPDATNKNKKIGEWEIHE